MPVDLYEQVVPSGRNVRLDTLVRLRWLAVIGQTTAVLVVYLGLDFELPSSPAACRTRSRSCCSDRCCCRRPRCRRA
jgi:hypothetical protein